MNCMHPAHYMGRHCSTTNRIFSSLLFTCILLTATLAAFAFGEPEVAPSRDLETSEFEGANAGARVSEGDVDVPVLHKGDRWTYHGVFDVEEMIASSGVSTDAETLVGELDMWVEDLTTWTVDNHSSIAYRVKSEGEFIGLNITLSGTLGDIEVIYASTDIIRAGDLATIRTEVYMHVKFWINPSQYIDVAEITVTDSFHEPVEDYDFPLRVGEEWTNDFLDVNWWQGGSNFFTIPEDDTLAYETSHQVMSVGDPVVEYAGCENSYNVTAFDENETVTSFRWWCPAAKNDAWRHFQNALGMYVDFYLIDFEPATTDKYFEVELEYPTWALNMPLGVWVNVTDANGTPIAGQIFILRYEYEDVWITKTTEANGSAFVLLNTSDPLDSTPSNHDYASHGIVAWDPVEEYFGVDTLTLDDELVVLDYRPRPGGISVDRQRGNDSLTLNPVYGFNAIPGDEIQFTIPIENKGTTGGPASELEMVEPDGSAQRGGIDSLPPVGEDVLQFTWTVPAEQPSDWVSFSFEVDPDDLMTGDVNQSNDIATFDLYIGRIPSASLAAIPPTPTLTNFTIDATGSSDADGGTIHCTFEVEVTYGDFDTFQAPDCQLELNWTDNGLFLIELTVSDEENDVDSTSMTVEILNRLPWVNIEASVDTIDAEQSVHFDAYDSDDDDTLDSSAPISFRWLPPTRSDGVEYTCDQGPITMECTVTPMEEGDFVMQLSATDDDDEEIIASYTVDITNIAPRDVVIRMDGGTAANDEPAPATWEVDEDQEVTLSAEATDTLNDQNSLNWNWHVDAADDPTRTDVTTGGDSEIEVVWTEDGTHRIELEVIDDNGASAGIAVGFVMVNNVPPTVGQFGPLLPVGEDRILEMRGTYSDTESDLENLRVCWDVDLTNDADDDLNERNDCDYIGIDLAHSWPEAGEYQIRFHATDDDGAVAEALVNVTVVNLRPKAKAVAEVTALKVGEELVIWTNETTDTESDMSLLRFVWDVDTAVDSDGDGDPKNDVDKMTSRSNPLRHTYDTPGTKTVRLTVSDEGYSSTVEIQIAVQPAEKSLMGLLGSTAGISNLLIVIGLVVMAAVILGATSVLRKGDEQEAWVEEEFNEDGADGGEELEAIETEGGSDAGDDSAAVEESAGSTDESDGESDGESHSEEE